MASVRFENISKRFEKTEVVKNVSFEIADGEFMVLVGPSGCGKSTCLRMMAGLETPDLGQIWIDDQVVNDLDPKDRDLAMVFQNYALYPQMSVFDNMGFGLKMRKVPKAEIRQRVTQVAKTLKIEELLNRKPKALSGGQRQRVALGRSLVRNARVALMDEPLSNLDAKLRVDMRAEINRLHREFATTTVYVTHDQVEAMTMGERIIVLNKGTIQQMGTPNELYNEPANKFVASFIGTPSMNFFENVRVRTEDNLTFLELEGIGARLPLFPEQAEKALTVADRPLTLGIRPENLEDVALANQKDDLPPAILQTIVDVRENLGNQFQVYFKVGDHVGVATLSPRSNVTVGGQLDLLIDMSRVHLFDAETEIAIF